MGKRLIDMYDEAKKMGGLMAQIRLAVLTKMPANKAAESPDSPENITVFVESMKIVKKEFTKYQNN
jgi:hypothetical protein